MTAHTSGAVLLTEGPGHLLARMNCPGRRNALDPTLLTGLSDALDQAERDDQCRVFVVAAAGADFCVGMDLAEPPHRDEAGEPPYWRLLRRLATSPLLTVASVDGPALAGGVGLAAACDVVLAGSRARFRLTEVLLGLLPAMALPFITRRIGEHQAFRLALTAAELNGVQAQRLGLADEVVARAEESLRPAVTAARRLAPGTVAAVKRYRAEAFPLPAEIGRCARHALAGRLAEPAVRHRLATLRQEGVLG